MLTDLLNLIVLSEKIRKMHVSLVLNRFRIDHSVRCRMRGRRSKGMERVCNELARNRNERTTDVKRVRAVVRRYIRILGNSEIWWNTGRRMVIATGETVYTRGKTLQMIFMKWELILF